MVTIEGMAKHTLLVGLVLLGCGSESPAAPDGNGGQQSTGGATAVGTGGLGGSGIFDPANPSMTYEFRDPGADLSDCTECVNETLPHNDTPGLCCHGREYFRPYGVCSCTAPDGG